METTTQTYSCARCVCATYESATSSNFSDCVCGHSIWRHGEQVSGVHDCDGAEVCFCGVPDEPFGAQA